MLKIIGTMAGIKDERVAKATDWVPNVGPDTFILYGCSEEQGCGIYPLHANHWYRMSNIRGADGCYEKDGFWVCAHCTRRYRSKHTAHKRLFFYPSTESWLGGREIYLVAFWGYHDETQNRKFDQQVTILKGARLIKELNRKAITYEHVIQAVGAISDRAEVSMMKHYADVIKEFESAVLGNQFSTELYCDDIRLSLSAPGRRFRAVDVGAFEKVIPSFSSDELQHLLDVCSAFYDLRTYRSVNTRDPIGPSDLKMIKDMETSARKLSVEAIVRRVLA